MPFQTLTYEKQEALGVIKLFDLEKEPGKKVRCSEELFDLCEEIALDEETRVILLTGAGENAFSIGSERNDEVITRSFSLSQPISQIDRPVIAAIPGDAIGQGLEMVLSCDLRIAAETSRFGLPQIKTGFMPRDGGTQRLSRTVGMGKSLEMILTGEMIDAQEAYRIGLLNKVVPSGQLMITAMDTARKMASRAPIALRYGKEAVYKGMEMTLEQGLRLEADLSFLLLKTKDRLEGITAFREKRKPRFEGR